MKLRQPSYPVADICAVVGLARSTFYHRQQEQSDAGLREALSTLATDYPTYGYRRLTALLGRQGWQVNHKRVQRVMREMGLQRPVKKRKTRTTNSDHAFPRYPNLVGADGSQTPRRDLGGGHHLCALGAGLRVSGGHYGCVHSGGARLASEPLTGSPLDPEGAAAGAGVWTLPADPP